MRRYSQKRNRAYRKPDIPGRYFSGPAEYMTFSGWRWNPAVTGMPMLRATLYAHRPNLNGRYRCTTSAPANAARNSVSLGLANCICCLAATQETSGTLLTRAGYSGAPMPTSLTWWPCRSNSCAYCNAEFDVPLPLLPMVSMTSTMVRGRSKADLSWGRGSSFLLSRIVSSYLAVSRITTGNP